VHSAELLAINVSPSTKRSTVNEIAQKAIFKKSLISFSNYD
jgi:hypothetical protein